jgi:hypothetical protein
LTMAGRHGHSGGDDPLMPKKQIHLKQLDHCLLRVHDVHLVRMQCRARFNEAVVLRIKIGTTARFR